MARLVTSGFELQSIAAGAEGQGYTVTGSAAIETSVVRSGAASLKAASLSGAHNVRWVPAAANQWTYVAGRAYYARTYLRISANPAVTLQVLSFSNTNTRQGDIAITSSGTLILRTGGATTLQTSAALNTGEWYRVELMLQQDATHTNPTTTGTLEMRLNGVTVGTQVTGTDAGALDVNRVTVGQISGNNTTGGILYFDDVAINDDQGASQNSWPGDGKVVLLPAASDSSQGLWKKGDNSAPGTLATSVDTVPPTGKSLAAGGAEDQIRNAVAANFSTDGVCVLPSTAHSLADKRVTVLQVAAVVATSAARAGGAFISISANPSGDTPLAINTSSSAASTYPTGWLTLRSSALYSPTLTDGVGSSLRLQRADDSSDSLICCYFAACVEYRENVTLSPATSTSTAQALDVDKKVAATSATETDSAQAANVDKSVTRTPAVETDTAQALVVTKPIYKTLTAATETDSAQALDTDKKVTLGSAVETDTAQTLQTSGPQHVSLTAASETDSAQALNVDKTFSATSASETDAAQGLDADKQLAVAPASETDSAQTLGITRPIYVSIAPATETDEAQPLTTPSGATPPGGGFLPRQAPHRVPKIKRPIYVTLGVATESDTAQALEIQKARSLSALEEELVIALVL